MTHVHRISPSRFRRAFDAIVLVKQLTNAFSLPHSEVNPNSISAKLISRPDKGQSRKKGKLGCFVKGHEICPKEIAREAWATMSLSHNSWDEEQVLTWLDEQKLSRFKDVFAGV